MVFWILEARSIIWRDENSAFLKHKLDSLRSFCAWGGLGSYDDEGGLGECGDPVFIP